MAEPGRILSIQSHVAFGYVGNKAAVFPLQCLGYDVDVVNTVNFSNHSGYRRSGGTKTTSEELRNLFDSLKRNEMLQSTRLLTGFIPGAEPLSAVAELAKALKTENSGLIYLMDPVIGDGGHMYVSPDVVPVYRAMLSDADIITPNWYEAEVLSGVKIDSLASLRKSLDILHRDLKIKNVVISSLAYSKWLSSALPVDIKPMPSSEEANQFLACLCSSVESSEVHIGFVPFIPGYFSGVGDLFSALLIGHYDRDQVTARSALAMATSLALSKTYDVLKLTYQHARNLPVDDRLASDDEADAREPLRRTRRMRGRELRLIQGQDIIRNRHYNDITWMQLWTDFWNSNNGT